MILQIIISNGILDLVTGILAKISLGTGIWAKSRLGTGIWYPPSRPSTKDKWCPSTFHITSVSSFALLLYFWKRCISALNTTSVRLYFIPKIFFLLHVLRSLTLDHCISFLFFIFPSHDTTHRYKQGLNCVLSALKYDVTIKLQKSIQLSAISMYIACKRPRVQWPSSIDYILVVVFHKHYFPTH